MIPTEIAIEKYLLVEALVKIRNSENEEEKDWYERTANSYKNDIARLTRILENRCSQKRPNNSRRYWLRPDTIATVIDIEKHLIVDALVGLRHAEDDKGSWYSSMIGFYKEDINRLSRESETIKRNQRNYRGWA